MPQVTAMDGQSDTHTVRQHGQPDSLAVVVLGGSVALGVYVMCCGRHGRDRREGPCDSIIFPWF